MIILITGATGFLGPYLMKEFGKIGHVIGLARGGAECNCNLADRESVNGMLSRVSPQIIVHSAALTDVDECSRDPKLAVQQNLYTTENLVRHIPGDCRFIYISSDMVYSGIGPHRENPKSENPLNSYGLSKLMGEFAAAKAANYLNIRTNFYGLSNQKKGLVEFLVAKMKSKEPLPIFTDLLFSPLWAQSLAERLVLAAKSKRVGTYNFGAAEGMSKAKFAMLVADGLGLDPGCFRPIESAGLKDRAIRPLDTRMDVRKTEASFDFSMPSMEEDIKAMCRAYKCAN